MNHAMPKNPTTVDSSKVGFRGNNPTMAIYPKFLQANSPFQNRISSTTIFMQLQAHDIHFKQLSFTVLDCFCQAKDGNEKVEFEIHLTNDFKLEEINRVSGSYCLFRQVASDLFGDENEKCVAECKRSPLKMFRCLPLPDSFKNQDDCEAISKENKIIVSRLALESCFFAEQQENFACFIGGCISRNENLDALKLVYDKSSSFWDPWLTGAMRVRCENLND